MSLIVCEQTGIAYGADTVLSGVELRVEARDRLAIVGANGSGKSSLLDMLAGLTEPSQGVVTRERGLRLAYLPQDAPEPTAATVLDEVIASREDLAALHARLQHLEQRMAAGGVELEAVMAEYGEAQQTYEAGGGYDLEARAREALGGLGLDEAAQRRPPRELSGGQVRRLEMAKLLLRDADLLLLDEPTNHLDLGAIEWLETFFAGLSAALVVVSHDRRFLERICTRVLELSHGEAEEFPGSYLQFVRLRAERRERRRKDFETQRAHIDHQEEFIRKYKAGQRAREARGRQKQLDRLPRVRAPQEERRPRLRFLTAPTSQVLLRTEQLVAGRGAPLVDLGSMTIGPRDRVAIVGNNGSGKSTLLHTLAEELPAFAGRVRAGARMERRVYRQDLGRGDQAMELRTVLEELLIDHPIGEERGRNVLGALLFSGDDVHKQVSELSGGERGRLLMGKLTLEHANLLLLDEPTNHLDIPAQEVLEDALAEYAGAIVLVSHDRALIDALATRTWALEQGAVREVLGGYTDLLAAREREQRALATADPPHRAGSAPAPPSTARTEQREARVTGAAQRRASADVRRLEEEIAQVEEALAAVRATLLDPELFSDPARGARAGREHDRLSGALAELYDRWGQTEAG